MLNEIKETCSRAIFDKGIERDGSAMVLAYKFE